MFPSSRSAECFQFEERLLQISLNSELGVSGAHEEPDYSKDVAKVDIPVQTADDTEQFTIDFHMDSSTVNMDMAWDRTRIRVPIKSQ